MTSPQHNATQLVRVYFNDKSFKTFAISDDTTTSQLCEMFAKKMRLKDTTIRHFSLNVVRNGEQLKRLQNNGRPYHVQKEYLNHNVGWGATADNGFLFSLKFESAKRMSMHISGRKQIAGTTKAKKIEPAPIVNGRKVIASAVPVSHVPNAGFVETSSSSSSSVKTSAPTPIPSSSSTSSSSSSAPKSTWASASAPTSSTPLFSMSSTSAASTSASHPAPSPSVSSSSSSTSSSTASSSLSSSSDSTSSSTSESRPKMNITIPRTQSQPTPPVAQPPTSPPVHTPLVSPISPSSISPFPLSSSSSTPPFPSILVQSSPPASPRLHDENDEEEGGPIEKVATEDLVKDPKLLNLIYKAKNNVAGSGEETSAAREGEGEGEDDDEDFEEYDDLIQVLAQLSSR